MGQGRPQLSRPSGMHSTPGATPGTRFMGGSGRSVPAPTIGGREIPIRPDTTGRGPGFARDPRSGEVHSGGYFFDKNNWQWAPKPTLYSGLPPNSPRTSRIEAEMQRQGLDPNDRMAKMKFQASLDPEYAAWLKRARPDLDLTFNTDLSGLDPSIRDTIIERGTDALTKARLMEALSRGDVKPTGGPSSGTVPGLRPGSITPATEQDYMAQRLKQQNQLGMKPSTSTPTPTPGGGGRPTLTPDQTNDIINRVKAFGSADIGGRRYELNQFGAVVDVTNPNGRFRITDRTGKIL